MGIRNYSNTGQTSTLSAAIGATDTTITLVGYAGDPSPPFTAALARGTATEEIVLVTGVSGSTVTVTRGYDGTAPQAQGAGNTFQEVVVALDFREANNHVNATSGAHGITGSFVGTTDVQTLTNKTLTSPTLSGATLTGSATVATATATTLTVTGVTTLANASVTGTLAVTGAATLSGGGSVPTGHTLTLTDAPAAGTDAANKTYVDGKTWPSSKISDATASPTASTVVLRDASGRAQVATPSATADIATKGYADGLGVAANTASTIVRRDASGRAQFVDPSAAQDAATKNYVDAQTIAAPLGKMWRTSGFSGVLSAASGAVKVVMDASRVSGGVTFDNTNDSLVLPSDGFYQVWGRGYASGQSGYSVTTNIARTRSGVGDALIATSVTDKYNPNADLALSVTEIVPLKAGDSIWLQWALVGSSTASSVYWGTSETSGVMLGVRWIAPLNGVTPL